MSAAVLICLDPFITKAFHIDDPLSIWVAKQVLQHPANPFGFTINWWSAETTMAQAVPNPPANSYFMALCAAFLGWRESSVHFAFLWPAIAATIGTWRLATRFCGEPRAAALIALSTPVFIVSGTTVMCDMLLLAFWVWAIVLWVEGFERASHPRLLVSVLLILAATFTKYFGASLILLLGAYSVVRARRFQPVTLYLLLPIAGLVAYEIVTARLYGRGMFSAATFYQVKAQSGSNHSHVKQLLVGLAFTGGCFFSAAFYLPFIRVRRAMGAGLAIAVVAIIFLVQRAGTYPYAVASQVVLFAFLGTLVMALVVMDLWRSRDANGVLLACWIGGTFVFATFLNWSITARTFLPAAPALGILLVRTVEVCARERNENSIRRLFWPVLPAAILSLLVASADFQLAACGRLAARTFAESLKGQTVWFAGHWGFQYYMEQMGARPITPTTGFDVGDWIIVPGNNSNVLPLDRAALSAPREVQFRSSRFIATMSHPRGAGFYSDIWGPLPWAIGSAAPESYQLFQVK